MNESLSQKVERLKVATSHLSAKVDVAETRTGIRLAIGWLELVAQVLIGGHASAIVGIVAWGTR